MRERAVGWAASVLGHPVVAVAELPGGLTSTMLALTDASGSRSVLRLMTEEPWRSHGAALTMRESAAQRALAGTDVPAPRSLGLDAHGRRTGVAAHLMSCLPGAPVPAPDTAHLAAMARALGAVHAVHPGQPFRHYRSWAGPEKWVVPEWATHPASWERAFALLQEDPPPYTPTFLHRDFSHRNLLWEGEEVAGVVDWVETSIGPAWLDAAHAATNLAVSVGTGLAWAWLDAYAAHTGGPPERYWLVMDAVGFLPSPGRAPLFGSSAELRRLEAWLHAVMTA